MGMSARAMEKVKEIEGVEAQADAGTETAAAAPVEQQAPAAEQPAKPQESPDGQALRSQLNGTRGALQQAGKDNKALKTRNSELEEKLAQANAQLAALTAQASSQQPQPAAMPSSSSISAALEKAREEFGESGAKTLLEIVGGAAADIESKLLGKVGTEFESRKLREAEGLFLNALKAAIDGYEETVGDEVFNAWLGSEDADGLPNGAKFEHLKKSRNVEGIKRLVQRYRAEMGVDAGEVQNTNEAPDGKPNKVSSVADALTMPGGKSVGGGADPVPAQKFASYEDWLKAGDDFAKRRISFQKLQEIQQSYLQGCSQL